MTEPIYGGLRSEVYNVFVNGQIQPFTFYGEYLEYKLPIPIVPISYRIDYANDSKPWSWVLLGKLGNGNWIPLIFDPSKPIRDQIRFERPGLNTTTLTVQISEDTYYIGDIVTNQRVDTIRLIINLSTGTSVKVSEFSVTDQVGNHMSFVVPFCTNTNSMYHSGSLNFSRIDSFSLNADLPTDFYAVGHQVLEIEHGMCTNVI